MSTNARYRDLAKDEAGWRGWVINFPFMLLASLLLTALIPIAYALAVAGGFLLGLSCVYNYIWHDSFKSGLVDVVYVLAMVDGVSENKDSLK